MVVYGGGLRTKARLARIAQREQSLRRELEVWDGLWKIARVSWSPTLRANLDAIQSRRVELLRELRVMEGRGRK